MTEYEFALFDIPDCNWQAGGTAPDRESAEREAMHYLSQYANDDTGMRVVVYEVTRKTLRIVEQWPGEEPQEVTA